MLETLSILAPAACGIGCAFLLASIGSILSLVASWIHEAGDEMKTLTYSAVRVFAFSTLCLLWAAQAVAAANVIRRFGSTSMLSNCALGQCFNPASPSGAIGTTQFMESTNGGVAIYDKATGNLLRRVTTPAFWASAGAVSSLGLQRVLFDHYTHRWISTAIGATDNVINVGVSETADALGNWRSVVIPITPVAGFIDLPTLSLDDKAVYIATANFATFFEGTTLLVIPKDGLYGAVPNVTGMTALNTSRDTDNGISIQPALNWQGNPSNTVAVVAQSTRTLPHRFYRLLGVDASATQTLSAFITGTSYLVPGFARQPDGTRLIETYGGRTSANAVQVDGRVFFVDTVRSTTDDFAVVRLSVIDASTGALLAQSFIQEANYDIYQGAIAVNAAGAIVVAYNRSGFLDFGIIPVGRIRMFARAFRLLGDTPVADGAELELYASDVSDYRCGARDIIASCRDNWGYYSAVSIDPADQTRFYVLTAYAGPWAMLPAPISAVRAIWRTQISEIRVPSELIFRSGFE